MRARIYPSKQVTIKANLSYDLYIHIYTHGQTCIYLESQSLLFKNKILATLELRCFGTLHL